jgi:hypothetical protein
VGYKTDIIIFLGLLTLTFFVWLFAVGESAIDIQLHDTYFVLDNTSLAVLILGPLTFLIFLARGLATKFKSIGANAGLIVGLILLALITYGIIELQKSYLTEIMRLDTEEMPASAQSIVDMETKINWTWSLMGLWIMGIILLTAKTIMIRKVGDRQNVYRESCWQQ